MSLSYAWKTNSVTAIDKRRLEAYSDTRASLILTLIL